MVNSGERTQGTRRPGWQCARMGVDEGIVTSLLALGALIGLLFAVTSVETRMGRRSDGRRPSGRR
ncbi:hypothetical protein GCM10009858_47150 [Terrabacter carboxydivorans]|uniref:Uncharacterized protein n=1 Tax=Terrabacter carboxydivorans TaxID=619730 RepID=A0ABN3MLD7_9MICO